MSKYTITIKNLIDNNFKFALDDYPIFDESYRPILNQKILNHFYMREIGFETAELFNFYLKNTMNEIMPYYNELYKSKQYTLDHLFDNINVTEIFTKNLTEINTQDITSSSTSNSTSKSNNTNKIKNLQQDTPQGKISMTELDEQKWATQADMQQGTNDSLITDESDNKSSNKLNSDKTGIEDYKKIITGSNREYNIDLLTKIKDNILNIDMMIINDLNDLFFGLM